MTIEELRVALVQGSDVPTAIQILKNDRTLPEVNKYKKAYDPKSHGVKDPVERPDKQIYVPDANGIPQTRVVKVTRLPLPFQKRIVESSVTFCFGNPVKYHASTENDNQVTVLEGIKRIFNKLKIDSFNRNMLREVCRSTETAEYWFLVPTDKHSEYGFECTFKLRVMSFHPWDGNELYPLFDDFGDLIAFSRSFKRKEKEKTIEYFMTCTADEIIQWKQEGSNWEEISRDGNKIGKIPVVYLNQDKPDWYDVEDLISELEILHSNFGDMIKYNSAPTLVLKGDDVDMPAKGEAGKVLQIGQDSSVEYVSWDQAPESVVAHDKNLKSQIESFTQTPDLSFESMKGLGDPSGETIRMMMMGPHLKVLNKREFVDSALDRRISIVKAFIGFMASNLKADADKLEVENIITPYVINEEGSIIDRLVTATAGKAILSQRTAVQLSGLVDDVDNELKLIEEEEAKANTFEQTEPTTL